MSALVAGPTGQPSVAPVENTKELHTILAADRDIYFPGEAALFTLTIRNPKSTKLEVPAPFSASNGCFALRKVLDDGTIVSLSTQPLCPTRIVDAAAPSIAVLGAGEQRQASLSADTLAATLNASLPATSTRVLNRPGYYQLEYLFYNAHPSLVFRVAQPHFEAVAVAKLQDIAYADPASGRIVKVSPYVHAFAVRWNNQSFICVSQNPESKDTPLGPDARGNFTGADFPYIRIAATQESVKALTASVDDQDHVTIAWQDAAGAWQNKVLENYPSETGVTAAAHIGLDPTAERLNAGSERQFNATAVGSANNNLKWSVSLGPGAPADARPGVVSATGLYSAPAKVSRPYTVIVKARSGADSNRSAIAVVALTPESPVQTAGARLRGFVQ
jgi:hypothetical protein